MIPAPVPAACAICDLCGKEVSEKVAAFCRQHPARFGGQIYGFNHQSQY